MENKSFSSRAKSEARNFLSVFRESPLSLSIALLGASLASSTINTSKVLINSSIVLINSSIVLINFYEEELELRTPCSQEELAIIRQARIDILQNITVIADLTQTVCESLSSKDCPKEEVIVKTFRKGFGDAYVYCVDDLNFEDKSDGFIALGVTFDTPDKPGEVGSYAIRRSQLSNFSSLHHTIAHEETHILFDIKHDASYSQGGSEDWVYAIGHATQGVINIANYGMSGEEAKSYFDDIQILKRHLREGDGAQKEE